ncbi:MAG: TIGR00366 family protein [Actinobacteria bacterium]|nr:TIGR00366 family protein [Actinomycetota bacterium]
MQRLGNWFAEFSRRWVPDAFVFAVLLTFAVYVLALVFGDHGPLQLVTDWYNGFWELLEFAMQMTLILVTGYALAASPPLRRGLERLADLPRGGASAVALTALTAGLLGLLHWGLGLIAGALLAREVATRARGRGIRVHFPLVAAAGYVGLGIWHSGLSGSAPLLVNTEGHFLQGQMGIVPLAETTFLPFNLIFVVVALVIAPLLLARMHPRAEEAEQIEPPDEEGGGGQGGGVATQVRTTSATPAQRLADSRLVVGLVVLAGLVFLVPFFVQNGVIGFDINVLNFTFLVAGLAMHGTLARYASAVGEGARAASGVIIQFPFYAGILGIMDASGLVTVIAGWFVAISTPLTYPFWTMVSAAAVNFAVPSGGGQWAVQGPVVVQATKSLGVDTGTGVMAVALGDQLTNMVQPFWALPLLGITGLRAGDVLGYTAALMLALFAVAGVCITFLS